MASESYADFVRASREALAAAGLVRRNEEGSVWWERGATTSDGAAAAPVVLIHGVNDHAGTWCAVAPAVAPGRRVLIPDLAGHGESAPASGPLPLSLIVARLEALLAGERELVLVGNSLGGWLALILALRHPDRVTRLVLESSGGLNRPFGVPLTATDRESARVILRAVHGPRYEPQEWVIEALLQRATDSPLRRLTELVEHDVEARLAEIRAPATLVWGADDGVLSLDYAEELCRALPRATLVVIDDAAHIPHIQQPGRFLECLRSIF